MAAVITDIDPISLENRYWKAIQTRDADAVAELTADDCTIVGASGVSAIDRRSIRELIRAAPYRIDSYTIDPTSVRVVRLADDTVAVGYAVREEVTVDGAAISLDAFDSSVWMNRNNSWTCVLHTESIAGDVFGRDRQQQ